MRETLDLPYSMKMIFKRVVTSPLGKDPRTDWKQGRILGNGHEANRSEVLKSGLADFTTAFRADETVISCGDKALLYCHYYLKYTFFACKRAFSDQSLAGFRNGDHPICLLDIGCGPGTAALAWSDASCGIRLFYVGIDESGSMFDLAARILEEARSESLISSSGQLLLTRCEDLNCDLIPHDANVLIVLSFCLGSISLRMKDIEALAEWIQCVAEISKRRPMICFVNSPHPSAIERFDYLKRCLGSWNSVVPLTSTNVCYYNYQRSIGGQSLVYEIGSPGLGD